MTSEPFYLSFPFAHFTIFVKMSVLFRLICRVNAIS